MSIPVSRHLTSLAIEDYEVADEQVPDDEEGVIDDKGKKQDQSQMVSVLLSQEFAPFY